MTDEIDDHAQRTRQLLLHHILRLPPIFRPSQAERLHWQAHCEAASGASLAHCALRAPPVPPANLHGDAEEGRSDEAEEGDHGAERAPQPRSHAHARSHGGE